MDESSRGEHVEEIGLVGVHRDPAYYSSGCRRGGAAAPVV
jgi:hypothetical protein